MGCEHYAHSPLVNMNFLPVPVFFNNGQWYINPGFDYSGGTIVISPDPVNSVPSVI